MPFGNFWMVAGHMEISGLGLPGVEWSKTTAWAVLDAMLEEEEDF